MNYNMPKCGKRSSESTLVSQNINAYIIEILKTISTSNAPLTAPKICDLITSKYHANVSRQTIAKKLDELYDFCINNPDTFFEVYSGQIKKYYIDNNNSTRTHKEYIDFEEYIISYGDNDCDVQKSPSSYYAFIPKYTAEEYFILQSSVMTNPYFSQKDTSHILKKLSKDFYTIGYDTILEQERTSVISNMRMTEDSTHLIGNLQKLVSFINMKVQIEINYGKYYFDAPSSKIKLIPRKLASNGTPIFSHVDPICILQANGFYYLIAHTDRSKDVSDVISYRVDRIISIRVCRDLLSSKPMLLDNDILKYRSQFSALEYIKHHPVMYAGEKTTIKMLVQETKAFSPVNALLDTFGRQIAIRPATDSETNQYLKASVSELKSKGETWYSVRLNHSIEGTVLWAKQHIDIALIIYPDEAVKQLTDAVTLGLSRYE